jgi:hypothetical protein
MDTTSDEHGWRHTNRHSTCFELFERQKIMRTIFFSTIWLAALAIWLQTLTMGFLRDGNATPIVVAGICFGAFVILYFAEGLELAVADLRDKDPSQIKDSRVGRMLAEMQGRSEWFFAQRQIFVVAIITAVSLSLDYELLYVFPFGWIQNHTMSFAFSITFVTLTVLWFCQVAPKRLAILNSETFLSQSAFLWPIIRLVGKLDMVAPVELIVQVGRKLMPAYDEPRNLPPSPGAYYESAVRKLGFGVDTLAVKVNVKADGSVQITKRFVTMYLHGHWRQVFGQIDHGLTSSSAIRNLKVNPIDLRLTENRESLKDISGQLDAIAKSSGPLGSLDGFSDNLLPEARLEIVPLLGEGDSGAGAAWSIRLGAALPEGYAGCDISGQQYANPIAVLTYEITADLSSGLFSLSGNDAWTESISFPCRTYGLAVECDSPSGLVAAMRQCKVGLGSLAVPFDTEQGRVINAFMSDAVGEGRTLAYPVQGCIYRVEIDFLKITGPRLVQMEATEHHQAPEKIGRAKMGKMSHEG